MVNDECPVWAGIAGRTRAVGFKQAAASHQGCVTFRAYGKFTPVGPVVYL